MVQKIIFKEPVVIPDGKGGVRECFLIDVPTLENETTGEIFLEDEALEILDREKKEAMARFAAQDVLESLSSRPDYATRLAGFPTRRHVMFRVAFGAGNAPKVASITCREYANAWQFQSATRDERNNAKVDGKTHTSRSTENGRILHGEAQRECCAGCAS